jgi:general secretion pathway protein D
MPITKSKLIVKVPETQKPMSLKHLQHACLGLFSLILTAMPAVTLAQETAESEIQNLPANAQDKLTLNFQDADIKALINAVSKITGKNFIVDPRIKGKVTLVSGEELGPEQIYEVFLSVLDVHNIVAIDSDGLVKLLPKAVAKQTPTPLSFDGSMLRGDAQITEVYQLKHGSVRDIVPILKPLLPPTSHFAAHGPTNTIIITDTGANIKRILNIVAKLDQEEPVGDTHVVYLQHAQSKDIVGLLTSLIASYQKAAGDPKAAQQKISIQAHEATNALVIHAQEEQMKVIRKVISQLDIRRAQVFVEAIIAEINEDRLGQLGISWQGTEVNSNGQISGGTEYDIGKGGLRLGFLSGFVTSLTGERVPAFNIILHALRTDSESNILSTPNLLTLDNEEAEIRVAQEVPFITGQFTTNVTTAPPQTDDGGTAGIVNPFQTIERKDVGLILKIKPQVNAGNTIRLEISEELSNISPTRVLGASDLITNKRIIKSTVVVENGQTVVLGGLILDDLSNTVDGVLGLSSIPVIGGLFKNKQKHQRKLNLMLFVKPTIIRTRNDLVGFTERKYGSMRERQLEANGRSEYLIRGLTPSVMPPLYEKPEITPIEKVISPDKKKEEPLMADDKDCSDAPYANNPCNN